MSVIQFPEQKAVFQPFTNFVRLGEGSHHPVAELIVEGTTTRKRVVIGASKAAHQRDLIELLRGRETEIVVDPRNVELSSRQKCGGLEASAPRASTEKGVPLSPDVFREGNSADIYGQVARMCVEFGVDAVLAPTQFPGTSGFDGWYNISAEGCELLRTALDDSGLTDIRIDYLMAARPGNLRKPDFQRQFITDLPSKPVNNLRLRLSMSPVESSPTNAQRIIGTLAGWHNVGAPIIMDYAGALAGEALLSMNVFSSIAHGFGEQATCTASIWTDAPRKREPEDGENRVRAQRICVTAFERTFTTKEMQVLLPAHGARSLLLRTKRHIAPNGVQARRNDALGSKAADSKHRLLAISRVPTVDRPEFFTKTLMREVAGTAKCAEKFNLRAESRKRTMSTWPSCRSAWRTRDRKPLLCARRLRKLQPSESSRINSPKKSDRLAIQQRETGRR